MIQSSTVRVLVMALIISLGGGFHNGYQFTVINPTENMFRMFINESYYSHYGSYLNETQWTILWPFVVNMQTMGALIGIFFVKSLLENRGRKPCFYWCNGVAVAGCALQAIAKPTNSWEIFLMARLILGIVQGIQLGLQPVYLNEISPKAIRGLIGSMTGFTLEFGFLLASVLALESVLGGENTWPYLLLVEAMSSLVALVALPYFPESPKYLASRGDYDGAEMALRILGRNDEAIKEEIQEVKEEIARECETLKARMSIREAFKVPYIRKGILLGWVGIFASIYSGIAAFSYFSTRILQDSGVSEMDAQYGTIGMTAPCCLGALVGAVIVDRLGRRPVIIWSMGIMLALNILFIIFSFLARVYDMGWAGYANIGITSIICLTFGLGPASAIWYLSVELVPHRAKPIAHTSAVFVNRLTGLSAGLIFYPLHHEINEFSFLLHVLPLSLGLIYMAVALPETKNKTNLEIIKELGYEYKEEKVTKRNEEDEDKVIIEKF